MSVAVLTEPRAPFTVSIEGVTAFLDRDGELVLSVGLAGRPHAVTIRPAAE